MPLTATDLRTRLYAVLDQVLTTGEPVFVARGGKLIKIGLEEAPTPRAFRWDQLVERPEAVAGDDDISDVEWSAEWSHSAVESDTP